MILIAGLVDGDVDGGLGAVGIDQQQRVALDRVHRQLDVRGGVRIHHAGGGGAQVLDLTALGADSVLDVGGVVKGNGHHGFAVFQAALVHLDVGVIRESELHLAQPLDRVSLALLAAGGAEGDGLSVKGEVGAGYPVRSRLRYRQSGR